MTEIEENYYKLLEKRKKIVYELQEMNEQIAIYNVGTQ